MKQFMQRKRLIIYEKKGGYEYEKQSKNIIYGFYSITTFIN